MPRQNSAQESNRWVMLAACLLAPAVAGLIRKLLPGQPVFIDAAPTVVVLAVGLRVLLDRNRPRLPRWIAGPLLYWALGQALYAIPSVFEDWRVGAAAVMIRVVPMMMAVIAFAAIRTWDDLTRASTWVCSLAPILFPVGIIVALFGNQVLPFWLQPIENLAIFELEFRAGAPIISAIFTTNGILAMSMLAVLFLSLASVAMAEMRKQNTTWWWLVVAAAFLLVYLSTRRGMLIGAAIGVGMFVLGRRKLSRQAMFGLLIIMGVITLVDTQGLVIGSTYRARSEFALNLDFYHRLSVIFIPIFWFWIQAAPLGNYLGFTGPEAKALGVDAYRSIGSTVEIGGAQLAAEMGIFGALLMPVIIAILILNVYRRARRLCCRQAVNTLLVFQVVLFILYYAKQLAALSNVSLAQFFFWAVPGICAALIQREKEALTVVTPDRTAHVSDLALTTHRNLSQSATRMTLWDRGRK